MNINKLIKKAREAEEVSQESLMAGVVRFSSHLEYSMMLKLKSFAMFLSAYQSQMGKLTAMDRRKLEREMLLPAGRFCVLFDLYASLLRMEENMGIPAGLRMIKVCQSAKQKLKEAFIDKGFWKDGETVMLGVRISSFDQFIADVQAYARRREIDVCSQLWIDRAELEKAAVEQTEKEVK